MVENFVLFIKIRRERFNRGDKVEPWYQKWTCYFFNSLAVARIKGVLSVLSIPKAHALARIAAPFISPPKYNIADDFQINVRVGMLRLIPSIVHLCCRVGRSGTGSIVVVKAAESPSIIYSIGCRH